MKTEKGIWIPESTTTGPSARRYSLEGLNRYVKQLADQLRGQIPPGQYVDSDSFETISPAKKLLDERPEGFYGTFRGIQIYPKEPDLEKIPHYKQGYLAPNPNNVVELMLEAPMHSTKYPDPFAEMKVSMVIYLLQPMPKSNRPWTLGEKYRVLNKPQLSAVIYSCLISASGRNAHVSGADGARISPEFQGRFN